MSPTPPRRLPLSVSLIASNEAANLPRCLASVQDWVQEIVVVTNDCTDATAAIARAAGARVIDHIWQDFQTQKNESLRHCTQPWVLCLDADEAVSPALAREIAAFFSLGRDQQGVGVRFPRLSWFMGRWIRHGDWYPDHVLRLAPRDACRWGGDPAHTALQVQGRVLTLRSDLLHFPYPNLKEQVRKMVRQSDDFVRHRGASVQERGRASRLAVFVRPAWRFFRCYVLRAGFLDGVAGWYVAQSVAFGALLRYARLYELLQPGPPTDADSPSPQLPRSGGAGNVRASDGKTSA